MTSSEEMAELLDKRPLGIHEDLPEWARPKTVNLLVRKHGAPSTPMPLGVTAGQALVFAWLHTILLWSFILVFMVLTWKTAECTAGLANYQWFVWMAAAPVLLVLLLLEFHCLKWIIVPKYQVLGELSLWGCPMKSLCPSSLSVSASFKYWLAFKLLVSATRFANFATDSAFLGIALKAQLGTKSDQCESSDFFDRTWEQVWRKSVWSTLPCISLIWLCAVAWGTNFVVLAFSLGLTYPWSGEVDYEVAFNEIRDGQPEKREDVQATKPQQQQMNKLTQAFFQWWNPQEDFESEPTTDDAASLVDRGKDAALLTGDVTYHTEYSTPFLENQNHGAALMVLAETNGMESVVWGDLRYAVRKADMVSDKKKRREHIISQMRRGFVRIFGAAITDGFQLNVQITIFAIQAALYRNASQAAHEEHLRLVHDHHMNDEVTLTHQATLSFVLSIICLVLRFVDAVSILRQVNENVDKLDIDSEGPEISDSCSIRGWKVAVASAALTTLAVAIYAGVKLCKIHQCHDAVWNIGGCVDLS
eukprot:TRINITY_DN89506_c0_g1_i1.p1 TRINITY_DN89506_c0_g1~~TRINITY_DN89506_c0_g1_i1.p1  ORF type:complete len:532 (-),score=78.31 TRINITY_DN89506_c0_g1_i1:279-1874(-)